MNATARKLPPPPKTSIFDKTMPGLPEAEPLESSLAKAVEPMPTPGKMPLRPKTSIFDKTMPGLPEAEPLKASQGTAIDSIQVPSGMRVRLKTSIFDKTIPGLPEAEPLVPSPANTVEPMPAPSPMPLRPKTSIFDKTIPGLPEAEPPAPSLANTVEPIPEPSPMPLRPKTSIFDDTQHGQPAKPHGVFQRVSKNEPETDASPDPVKTAPGSFDGSSELETNAALPASGQAPKVSPDPDDWDEGTAAEWNPRWSEANKLREQELSSKNQAVDPRKGARILRWLLPLIGLCAVVILAAFVFIPRFKASAVDTPSPRSIPPALQAYHDKAEAGDLAAMRMLGLRYCYGLAAPADRNEGIKWLRRAAKNGNAAARQELASMGVGMD